MFLPSANVLLCPMENLLGTCDRKSGECQCYDGFWGEGCRRSACPNECSGHGVCQSLEKFANDYKPYDTTQDVTAEYDTAWDAKYQYGCKCDDGFRGPDCSVSNFFICIKQPKWSRQLTTLNNIT